MGIIEVKTPPHLTPDLDKIRKMADRLQQSENLLKRAFDAMRKAHWAEGESEREVCEVIRDYRDNHGLNW